MSETGYVATREFFPRSFAAFVKQKTRWVYGIYFEGMHRLGWQGNIWDKYFFFRDRKGMLTNLLPPLSFALLILYSLNAFDLEQMPYKLVPYFNVAIGVNVFSLFARYAVR